jgi:hypothetical protein
VSKGLPDGPLAYARSDIWIEKTDHQDREKQRKTKFHFTIRNRRRNFLTRRSAIAESFPDATPPEWVNFSGEMMSAGTSG